MSDIRFLKLAQKIAEENVVRRGGEPFGAIVVRNGKVIGIGRNETIHKHDPTAHAIFLAIRNANLNIKSADLSGSTIYTNAEPCAMCESAAYWAQIEKIVFGITLQEEAGFGYLASQLYGELCIAPQEQRSIPSIQINFKDRFKYLPFTLYNFSPQNTSGSSCRKSENNDGNEKIATRKCKKCHPGNGSTATRPVLLRIGI